VGVVIKGLENVNKAIAILSDGIPESNEDNLIIKNSNKLTSPILDSYQLPNITNQISTGYSTLNGRPIKVTLLDKEEDIYCLELDINTHTQDSLRLAKYLELPQAFVFCAVGYIIDEENGEIVIDVEDICNKINLLDLEPKAKAPVVIQDLIKSKDIFMYFSNIGTFSDGLHLSLSLDINQQISCKQEGLKLIITTKPTGSCELGFYLGVIDENSVKIYKRIYNQTIFNHALELSDELENLY